MEIELQKNQRLTEHTYKIGLGEIRRADQDLSGVLETFGDPPIWLREPGFVSLVRIILEQQVSLASADAAFSKLVATITPVTPAKFIGIDKPSLRAIGFSRQKAAYCRSLAQTILRGELILEDLELMEVDDAREALRSLYGIGPWTSDIYLLMALGEPDIWPDGDLALAVAMQEVKNLPDRPSSDEMSEVAEDWRPWRSVAARVLWHYYLSR